MKKASIPEKISLFARVENESGDVNEKRCFPCRDLDSGQPVGDGVPIFTRTRCTQEQVSAMENGNTAGGTGGPQCGHRFLLSRLVNGL